MADSGLTSRQARATYHPKGYGVSEGLKRARRPFRTRNMITGGLISAFAFSVYMYSIRAVAQDDFADLAEPVSEDTRRNLRSIEEEKRYSEALVADRLAPQPGIAAEAPQPTAAAAPVPGRRSILQMVQGAFGGRGAESKIVWGAPSVDRLGRIGAEVPQEQYSRRLV
ncbi:hypothetical protein NBRC10513v2_001619 [Rhodotorula toruloides]|nr:hypothetical protein AAT19DRAFT_15286 [Rhodotorula toruloides]